MIPHNKPYIDKNSYSQIKKTLDSGWINYSNVSKKAEKLLSKLILNKKNNAVLTMNGTSSLYLALKALKVSKKDEVIIPTYTCTALLNAIYMLGAKPIIVDISKNNLSLNESRIKKFISKKTKAIIVVHTFGIPCELDQIKTYNIPIIEDCSQSLGSKFKDGKSTGSKGDIAIFSFYASKVITGGIGGAIITNNKKLLNYIKDYINFDMPAKYKKRFNFQISDINSSLIYCGLKNIKSITKKRRKIARIYKKTNTNNQIRFLKNSNYYRFIIKFKSKEELHQCKKYLHEKNIDTIIPIQDIELLHNYLNLNKNNYQNAESIVNKLLSIPIFPTLQKSEILYIKRSLDDYFCSSTSL